MLDQLTKITVTGHKKLGHKFIEPTRDDYPNSIVGIVSEIIQQAHDLKDDEVYVIPWAISRVLFPSYHQGRVLKKDNVLRVKRYSNTTEEEGGVFKQDIMRGRNPLETHIRNSLKNVSMRDVLVALDMQGEVYNDKLFKIFTLYDIFRAHVAEQELPDDHCEFDWTPLKDNIIYCDGGRIGVKVKSFTGDNLYSFTVKGLAVKKRYHKVNDQMLDMIVRNMFNFMAHCDCERSYNFDKHYGRYLDVLHITSFDKPAKNDTIKRKGEEVLIDQHILTAIYRAQREAPRAPDNGYLILAVPFVKPDRYTLKILESFHKNMLQEQRQMVYDPRRRTYNPRYIRKPLDNIQINNWLMKMVGYRNERGFNRSF